MFDSQHRSQKKKNYRQVSLATKETRNNLDNMHLSTCLAMLLCVGAALVSGGVLPYTPEGRVYRYALLVPLDDVTAGDIVHPAVFYSEQEESHIPVRIRRQAEVTGDVSHRNGGGTTVGAQVAGPLYKSGPHTVTGNGHVERTYGIPGVGNGPVIYGGGVGYDHATRGGASVDLTRTPMGTQLMTQGRGTVWQSRDRMSNVDAYGSYSRSYGGPFGTGRPNYGVGATFTHRF